MTSTTQTTLWCDRVKVDGQLCVEWFQADGKPREVRRVSQVSGWDQMRINGSRANSVLIDICPFCVPDVAKKTRGSK